VTRRGSGTLLWPIAGVFLVTALVGTLLQWLLVTVVLRPLEARDERARAELAAGAVASELADAPAMPPDAAVESLLTRQHQQLGRPAWIGFRHTGGTAITAPPNHAFIFAPAPGGGPASPGGDRAAREPAERGPAPGDRGPTMAERPAPGAPDSGASRPEPRRRGRIEELARRTVLRSGVPVGEVVVAHPAWSRGPAWMFGPPGPPGSAAARTALLVLPIALLASLLAGFVTVRLLVRRLRALEQLASRVAEGDLAVRIDDPRGDEIGRLAGGLDRMAERLAEARREVEDSDRQRRQLFADITHELATPLTSIRGYAETLVDPAVRVTDTERSRYVGGILEESRRLDRLIRDLFELARLEAGAAPLERESLALTELCRHTVERFLPRFRAAGVALTWEAEPGPAWIDADGRRIEQVLDNVFVNALRYVPRGGHVTIALGPEPGRGAYCLTVADDGPGIPERELPLVFQRFYRAAAGPAHTGVGAGSGLGLAIVREIVERHSGAVRARARSPHGLAIDIVLPAHA
jgi:signal transduction histidine kinase